MKSALAPRVITFMLICVLAGAATVAYVLLSSQRAGMPAQNEAMGASASGSVTVPTPGVLPRPSLMFLDTSGDNNLMRRVSVVPIASPDEQRRMTSLHCQRIYFAAGRGLCIGTDWLGHAYIFDDQFRAGPSLHVRGAPSRARVSPDGRYGALTEFVSGHSYADTSFSTQTLLVDMDTGEDIADLEQFDAFRDGAPFASPDFNFWGVTFTHDSNSFYATLGTSGKTYLVKGDIAARQVSVVREGVECPSISPDNTRLVFKQLVGPEAGRWHLSVLDLATFVETPVAETRSVDDQAEWIDDQHVAYSLPVEAADEVPAGGTIHTDLWAVPADGSGAPQLLVTQGTSPVVIR